MSSKTDERSIPQHQVIKGLNHPVRVQALTILTERTASVGEIARFLGLGASNVRYHIGVLERLDFIEIVEEERKRGVFEKFYRAIARPLLSDDDWKALKPPVREAISRLGLKAILDDASRSVEAGLFDHRHDRHLTRIPLRLDEKAWQNITAIQRKVLDAILDEQAASDQRRSESREPAIQAVAAMAFFEVPPRAS